MQKIKPILRKISPLIFFLPIFWITCKNNSTEPETKVLSVVSIPAVKDNTLLESSDGSLSDGAGQAFRVGRTNQDSNSIRRGVISFSFADIIPEGASIDSVALTLHLSQTNSGPQPVTLHRLIRDWGEGTSAAGGGMGVPATPGDATWIHTFFNRLFWENPGGDFASMSSNSVTVDAVDFYTWGTTDQMLADVQFWVDNPDSNFGWILLGNENELQTAKKFDSRESTITANQPVLTVRFNSPSSIDKKDNFALNFSLAQNYPNPFNIETTIRYTLLAKGNITLKVYHLHGE